MRAPRRAKDTQLNVRLANETRTLIDRLCVFYGRRMNSAAAWTITAVLEKAVRDAAVSAGLLKLKGGSK